MRSKILLSGLILAIIGSAFTLFGTLTGNNETTTTRQNILDNSYPYSYLGSHEYRTNANLVSGYYELRYEFSSNETVREFYVSVLDPDGFEIGSVYGPPAVYQNQSSQLTFDTQKAGQHTFILGGKWVSVQVNLVKLTSTTKVVYPYEIILYIGVLLLASGGVVSLSGVLMKEKHPRRWFD